MIARLLSRDLPADGGSSAGVGPPRTGADRLSRCRGRPFYEPQTVYTGLSLRDRTRPVDGARLGDARARASLAGRSAWTSSSRSTLLDARSAGRTGDPSPRAIGGALAVLLDLPEDAMTEAVADRGRVRPALNIRDIGARWRGEDCAPRLVHTIPSRAMLTDALAQLSARPRLGARPAAARPAAGRLAEAEAVRASAGEIRSRDRRRARIRAHQRPAPPRPVSNIALLTGGARYDVVWLADSEGEFGRYVPYATKEARPVVGSEGLRARAWDWTWERNGAPQLNQRFRRLAGRDMTPEDWAAWVGGPGRRRGRDARRFNRPRNGRGVHVLSDALALDLYKGVRGNFRDLGRPAAPADPARDPQRGHRQRAARWLRTPDRHARHARRRPIGKRLPTLTPPCGPRRMAR